MMEAALLQYGALGVFCVYLIYQNTTANKTQIEILGRIEKLIDTSMVEKTVLEASLLHERGISSACYDKIMVKLKDLIDKQEACKHIIEMSFKDLYSKLEQYHICKDCK